MGTGSSVERDQQLTLTGGRKVLERGDQAPTFELLDQNGEEWRLKDLQGQKVILYFYPADDTPGCTRESCDFRDSFGEWQKVGYLVLGISPQDIDSKRAFADKYNLPFPLLADEGAEIAKAYDVFVDSGLTWGDIPLVVKRSTFVIDEQGRIEQALYGVRSKTHVSELRELLGV
jgi:peroxiredoxin Q/BCP